MSIQDILFPKDKEFLDLLAQQAAKAVEGLKVLKEYVETGDDQLSARMTSLEVEGDALRRQLIQRLNKTFVTPIDREDLFSLSRSLDNILDYAENALLEMILFEIEVNEYLREMVGLLVEAGQGLAEAVSRLLNAPVSANNGTIRIKKLENEVANLYRYALYHQFKKEDAHDSAKFIEVYRYLKGCSEIIDQAADIIAEIVVKRT
ncbi:MAG: DUF47 family protein [Firmicutes bacterium]|nr:DUF47 family protein [Bacillota bacterium]MCL5040658.1 DUF47 family protein [Bacillota bacterium]